MAVCQGCQQEKPRLFKCGRCRSAEYCSKDCQRSAWRDHKPNCAGQVSSQTTVLNKTQMAILLGEGFSAESVQIPQTPLIPLIRQHFNQHKSSSDKDFTDVLMPVSDRLFGRPMRVVYDEGCANNRQPNTFATRDACSLQTGFGPNISSQALVYDINVGDYMCFDDQVCNVVQSFYEEHGGMPPTDAQLDRLRSHCQASYASERSNYEDSGSMIYA